MPLILECAVHTIRKYSAKACLMTKSVGCGILPCRAVYTSIFPPQAVYTSLKVTFYTNISGQFIRKLEEFYYFKLPKRYIEYTEYLAQKKY